MGSDAPGREEESTDDVLTAWLNHRNTGPAGTDVSALRATRKPAEETSTPLKDRLAAERDAARGITPEQRRSAELRRDHARAEAQREAEERRRAVIAEADRAAAERAAAALAEAEAQSERAAELDAERDAARAREREREREEQRLAARAEATQAAAARAEADRTARAEATQAAAARAAAARAEADRTARAEDTQAAAARAAAARAEADRAAELRLAQVRSDMRREAEERRQAALAEAARAAEAEAARAAEAETARAAEATVDEEPDAEPDPVSEPEPVADAPQQADAGGGRRRSDRPRRRGRRAPHQDWVAPVEDLTRKRSGQGLVVLFMLAAFAGAAYAGYQAWLARSGTELGIGIILAGLGAALWVVRISTMPPRITVQNGLLDVHRSSGHTCFDLRSSYTRIEVRSKPGRRRWRVRLERDDAPALVVDGSQVDPHAFMRVLSFYRPEVRPEGVTTG